MLSSCCSLPKSLNSTLQVTFMKQKEHITIISVHSTLQLLKAVGIKVSNLSNLSFPSKTSSHFSSFSSKFFILPFQFFVVYSLFSVIFSQFFVVPSLLVLCSHFFVLRYSFSVLCCPFFVSSLFSDLHSQSTD